MKTQINDLSGDLNDIMDQIKDFQGQVISTIWKIGKYNCYN